MFYSAGQQSYQPQYQSFQFGQQQQPFNFNQQQSYYPQHQHSYYQQSSFRPYQQSYFQAPQQQFSFGPYYQANPFVGPQTAPQNNGLLSGMAIGPAITFGQHVQTQHYHRPRPQYHPPQMPMFQAGPNQFMNILFDLSNLINIVVNQNEPPVVEPPVVDEPPQNDIPLPEPEPEPEPPVHQCPNGTTGSAGLFGDPYFGLFTPNIGEIPSELQAFDINIAPEDGLTSVLNDPDNGGFDVSVQTYAINPEGSTGVQQASITVGPDSVEFHNNGDLIVNGEVRGNISDEGTIAEIQLTNGSVLTSEEIDGPNGVTAERFAIITNEYKVTAAVRSPEGAGSYLDMNFEEITNDAANNATGHRSDVPGLNNPVTGTQLQLGIADLLSLESDSSILQFLQLS